MRKLVVSFMVVMALSACSNINDKYIEQGDWQSLGYFDGLKGQQERSHSELLSFKADVNDYDKGYEQGVAEYCNPNFAYQIGLSGGHYEGVCDSTNDGQKFRMEWQRGWDDSQ